MGCDLQSAGKNASPWQHQSVRWRARRGTRPCPRRQQHLKPHGIRGWGCPQGQREWPPHHLNWKPALCLGNQAWGGLEPVRALFPYSGALGTRTLKEAPMYAALPVDTSRGHGEAVLDGRLS